MLTFEFLLEDDRYRYKSVLYVLADSPQRARVIATEFLLRSRHHLTISGFVGREHQFTVGDHRLQRRTDSERFSTELDIVYDAHRRAENNGQPAAPL